MKNPNIFVILLWLLMILFETFIPSLLELKLRFWIEKNPHMTDQVLMLAILIAIILTLLMPLSSETSTNSEHSETQAITLEAKEPPLLPRKHNPHPLKYLQTVMHHLCIVGSLRTPPETHKNSQPPEFRRLAFLIL